MSAWIYMPPIDLEWDSGSKIRSLDNVGYAPSGGNKPIESHVLKWKAESKVSSLDEKHMAKVDRNQSAPQKDHVRRIKIPPTIPASNYKKVEYTRNGVYAIVEPVKFQGKSKIDFRKQDVEVPKRKPTDKVNVARRVKLTKNTRVDNYNHVVHTDAGVYALVEPVGKIEAKSKVDFRKDESVSERKSSENVDVKRRIKLTKSTRLDNYKHVEQTDDGVYAMVEPVGKIEVKSKVNFPKGDSVTERKTSENVDVTRRIKLTKNTRLDNYKHVEQTDDGVYAMVEPVGKIEVKSKVNFPKGDSVSDPKSSENVDVTRRIKLTKNTRLDNYKHVEQTNDGVYAMVEPVGKIEAKPKVNFPKPDSSKNSKRKPKVEPVEHKYKFF